VTEARSLEANGAAVVVAQRFEAGGHRGSFGGSPGAGMVGTVAVVSQIVDAVRIPVTAAGGVADERGLAAAFALGASGAQIGTSFLGCPEATASPLHRAQLRTATDDGTSLRAPLPAVRPARRQSLHRRDGRYRAIGVSAAGEPRRPALASADEEARAAFWTG
jgi:nitronate monooxygenase